MFDQSRENNEQTALKPISSQNYSQHKLPDEEEKEDNKHRKRCCCNLPKRYIVALMMFFGCANMGILRSELSVPIVSMTRNSTLKHDNGTILVEAEYPMDTKQQGLVLSSFFYGYVITQIPGGFISHRYGGKNVFGVGVAVTGLLSLLLPVCAANVYMFMANRFLQGFFLGVCFPAIYGIMRHWVTHQERSKLMTSSIAGKEFGIIACLGLSGVLTARLGWQSVFYTYGLIAIIWVFLWWLLVTETPSQHPRISQTELEYLENNINLVKSDTHNRPPYFRIFTSPATIAIIILDLCTYWCYYLMLTTLPTYLEDMYQFRIEKTGWLSAFPYIVLFITGILSGQVADVLISREYLSRTKTRKLFCTLCCVGMNTFLIGSTYAQSYATAMILLNVSFAFLGMSYPTFPVNALDIAPQYASMIMGVSNCLTVVSGIISPTLAGYIVVNKSVTEWRIVFAIAAGVNVLGSIAYLIFGSGERQSWATTDAYSQQIDEYIEEEKSNESKSHIY
ncbi:vesicular glutamate transporter 2-like [Tubulanus polymorphus]|uniref:vesicular glutamate transporter 2-like n=1 Tax=Tubulanus polymorphus TaxID=672921 RepID=UPI003DA5694E